MFVSGSGVENFVDYLVSSFGRVVGEISRIVSDVERYLYFIAWLNSELESCGVGRIVIVGGFATEVFTGGVYRTYDIDLITENCTSIVEKFLSRIAIREGRIYIPRLRELASKGIDIVGSVYSKLRPPITIRIGSYRIYMEPVEELIVKYLSAWKYWGSSEDRDKVVALISAWWDKCDREYVWRRAREENTDDKLTEVLGLLQLGSR